MKKIGIYIVAGIMVLGGGFLIWERTQYGGSDTPENNQMPDGEVADLEVVATGLRVPWEMDFLPNGDLILTERGGTVRVFGVTPVEIRVREVVERGEGGLLGLALHPDFVVNKFIYLYFTTQNNGTIINRVVRYIFDGQTFEQDKIILDNIPGNANHNGGRIAFGPDRQLYITTGDAGNDNLAQDTNSLAGKILRLADDGSVPSDNPFGNAIYSYGHRNPQGLAWDQERNLWATEHGRSGLRSGFDEINYIEKGANYGWPVIEGNQTRDGMKTPVVHSGPNDTWAPADIVFSDGNLFFTGLRGQALYQIPIISSGVLGNVTENFKNEFGRLRALTLDLNGLLYFATSNHDGRGSPNTGDDQIIMIR